MAWRRWEPGRCHAGSRPKRQPLPAARQAGWATVTAAPHHQRCPGRDFLWTIGNRGRDTFGDVVRPLLSPIQLVALLEEVGAWGVNLHDNDLVPIDATPSERDDIVRDFKR